MMKKLDKIVIEKGLNGFLSGATKKRKEDIELDETIMASTNQDIKPEDLMKPKMIHNKSILGSNIST